jgi:hypothetical protein
MIYRRCPQAWFVLPRSKLARSWSRAAWVAALQAPISDRPVVRRSDSLAVETGVNLEQFESWAQQLAGLAEMIADAVDES